MTVGEALRGAVERLRQADVPSPRTDAELLLAKALGLGRTELYLDGARALTGQEVATLGQLLERRAAREPLAYVLGEWGFRRLSLAVDRRVLVPRPETEVVVERCLALIAALPAPRVLDVGTGSGAIALTIADENPAAFVSGIDSSPEALEVARANLAATGLRDRVSFLEHDLRRGLAVGHYDLVVSNPPYVRPDEIEGLEPEVRDWEPRSALVGEGVAEQVAAAAPEALPGGGWVVLEAAAGAACVLGGALETLGYVDVATTPDLAGVERVVEGRWRSTTS